MSSASIKLVNDLRGLAEIGIVNARRDTALLRQAADWLEELERCNERLRAEIKRLNLFIAQYMGEKTDDWDEKRTSGLLEE